nr:multiple epidermal growth factor-like domains protein 10 [Crassostrea gigas]
MKYMYDFMDRWKVLVFYILMVSDANSPKIQNIKEVTKHCLYGQYKDGEVCKVCPAGYTGVNCSQKCTPPSYGFFCSKTCYCSYCHHEVGCMPTTEFTVNGPERKIDCLYNQYKDGNICKECPAGYFGYNCSMECDFPNYGIACSKICNCSSCHHALGCISSSFSSSESTEKGKVTKSTGNRIFLTQDNLIILLIGGTITLGLLVLIFYAIQRHRSLVMSNRNDRSSHIY